MPALAFFCYVYMTVPGLPCIMGEWLNPATTHISPGNGGYTYEDDPVADQKGPTNHRAMGYHQRCGPSIIRTHNGRLRLMRGVNGRSRSRPGSA